MKTYNVTLSWNRNTSKAGKIETLAEGVTIEKAEATLMEQLNTHDNVSVDWEKKVVSDSDFSPAEIWMSGDGSINYGDYRINIEEVE